MSVSHEVAYITDLMEQLDALQFEEPKLGTALHWVPESESGKRVFEELIAPENRQALKDWYGRARGQQMNTTAKALRMALEAAISERLS